jgi:hypothetical protein
VLVSNVAIRFVEIISTDEQKSPEQPEQYKSQNEQQLKGEFSQV